MDLGPDGNLCTEPPSGWFQDSATTFAYDSVGNRRDKGGQYTTGNRIMNFDSCTYQADFDGNVWQRACGTDTVTFSWSAENRLKSLTANGQTVDFNYDAAGRLIRQRVGGGVQRHFLWNGEDLLAELDGAGTGKVAEYSYYPGLDSPHAVIVGTTAYFAHRDGIGNVIALTDTAKAIKRTYAYDAWGKSVGGTDNGGFAGADRARFKGALWLGEETELYYMRARWYEPRSGRFLSEDPVGIDAGINPYVFADDDPINRRDPSGLESCPVEDFFVVVIHLRDGGRILIPGCMSGGGGSDGSGGGGGPPSGPSHRGTRGDLIRALYLASNTIPQGWQGSLWADPGRRSETLPGRLWDFAPGTFTSCPMHKYGLTVNIPYDPATGRLLGIGYGFFLVHRMTDWDKPRIYEGEASYVGGAYARWHGTDYGGAIGGVADCATGEGHFSEMSVN